MIFVYILLGAMTSVALVLAMRLQVWKWVKHGSVNFVFFRRDWIFLRLSESDIFSKMVGLGVLLPSLKTPDTQSQQPCHCKAVNAKLLPEHAMSAPAGLSCHKSDSMPFLACCFAVLL